MKIVNWLLGRSEIKVPDFRPGNPAYFEILPETINYIAQLKPGKLKWSQIELIENFVDFLRCFDLPKFADHLYKEKNVTKDRLINALENIDKVLNNSDFQTTRPIDTILDHVWYVIRGLENTQPIKQEVVNKPSASFQAQQAINSTPVDRARANMNKYPELLLLVGDPTNGSVLSTPAVYKGEGKLFSEQLGYTPAHAKELDKSLLNYELDDAVKANDLDRFTPPFLPKGIKLTQPTFNRLRALREQALNTPEKEEAFLVFNAVHDLGKNINFVRLLQDRFGEQARGLNHDELVLLAMQNEAIVSEFIPSLATLNESQRQLVLEAARTSLNLGQIAQLEGPKAGLRGFASSNLSKEAADFHLYHSVNDISGAAGFAVQTGSVVANEPNLINFMGVVDSLRENIGANIYDAYDKYVEIRQKQLDISLTDEFAIAKTRIGAMARLLNQDEGKVLQEVFDNQPSNVKVILNDALIKTGLSVDDQAILPYYGPDLLDNGIKARVKRGMDRAFAIRESLEQGIPMLARIFQEVKIRANKTHNQAPIIEANIKRLADHTATSEEKDAFAHQEIKIDDDGNNYVLSLEVKKK